MPAVIQPPLVPLGRVRRAVRSARTGRLLDLAVERGWLTPERRAGAAAAELDRGGLVQGGWLSGTAIGILDAAMAHEDFAGGPAAPTAMPKEAERHREKPGHELDEFVLVERLGAGGAGEVWRAWDRALGRWVAIKRPHGVAAAGEPFERLRREAIAAASVHHPHIVPVHRVGQSEGRPYIVMPLVTGRTLADIVLPIAQAVAAVRQIALALAHAHRNGLVHRDVKPGNLMLDDDGHVWLLDFGLAHAAARPGATRTGVALGTAAYMSPEQAAGDRRSRDPATDVYGLGATLYHLVTGAPPFEGDSFASIVTRVQTAEPLLPRSRRSEIPRDLETVLLTAMSKDPCDRYPSADALGADLARVLADEPVQARRPRIAERAWRRIRKHPRVAGVATVLVLACAAAAAFTVMRIHGDRAASLDALRQVARLSLQAALRLRRAGDHEGMRQLVPALEAAHARARSAGVRSAEIPYFMGRMQRALMDEERALPFQDAALDADPSFAPARYERQLLLSRAYDRRLHLVLGLIRPGEGPGVSAAAFTNVDAAARRGAEGKDRALAALRQTLDADARHLSAAIGLSEAQRAVVHSLGAARDARLGEAREYLRRAITRDPDLEEAWEMQAVVIEALGPLAEAEGHYTTALARDRGYVPLLVGRCRVRSSGGKHAGAVEDATAALAIRPDLVAAYDCRAMAWMMIGHARMVSGESPERAFDAAERDYAEALRRDPRHCSASFGLGTLHRYRAHHMEKRGGDPLPALDASVSVLSRALADAPASAALLSSRGRSMTLRATEKARAGQDPYPDFAAGEADLRRAMSHSDDSAFPEWLGDLLCRRGRARLARDGDPAEDFAAAEQAFFRIIPNARGVSAWALYHRGVLRLWRGTADERARRNPGPAWAAAAEDLDRAIQMAPTNADFRAERARLRALQPTGAQSRARDPVAAGTDR